MGNHSLAMHSHPPIPGENEGQNLHELSAQAQSNEADQIRWQHERRVEEERERAQRQRTFLEFQMHKRLIL